METINITMHQFLKYKALKSGKVHRHKKLVYKYAPNSLDIINQINYKKNEEVMQNILLPIAKLYDRGEYFGYVSYFKKNLLSIYDALDKKILNNLDRWMCQLFDILQKLLDLKFIYWDLHYKNVVVAKDGSPFLLDIDGILYMGDKVVDEQDICNQFINLIMFIFESYFDTCLNYKDWLKCVRDIFRKDVIKYLTSIESFDLNYFEFPYCVIEELKDEEKLQLIKSKLNN